jgi:ethanolamine utilization protein EutN
MILGKVIGSVWATRKSPRLDSLKLVLVQPTCWYQPAHDTDCLVAVDQLGARAGQDVLVCLGQPGRWMTGDLRSPVEASVMAIVDNLELAPDALPAPHKGAARI